MAGKTRLKQLAQDGATDGQVVTWNNAAGVYEPQTPSGGGSSPKAGTIVSGSFSGNPKVASIVFGTAFADNNYALSFGVVVSGAKSWVPTITAKSSTGFTVSLNSNNITGLTSVTWMATAHSDP